MDRTSARQIVARRRSFAAKPDEPVASFALISSIMPRGAGERPQTYRIALTIALVVALVAAIFGAMPIAVLVAAFAVPIVYIVYIYDVNLWEDEPIPVTGLAFALTGVLAIGFTALWTFLRGPMPFGTETFEGGLSSAPAVGTFLLVALLVPIVGEAIRQIGPVLLASRPEFDDLMDGLTFGVISGVAYACFDTLVRHWDLLTGGLQDRDPGLWVSLIFLEGFVKPLIMGTATGIACAEFSGLGRGYDGFTPRYFRGIAEAVLANIAYQAGTYLFSFVGDATLGVFLSIVWGLIILAIADPADPQRAARRADGGSARAVGPRGWGRRRRQSAVLRPVRDAARRARGLLQRLWHRGPRPGQGPQSQGPRDGRRPVDRPRLRHPGGR